MINVLSSIFLQFFTEKYRINNLPYIILNLKNCVIYIYYSIAIFTFEIKSFTNDILIKQF